MNAICRADAFAATALTPIQLVVRTAQAHADRGHFFDKQGDTSFGDEADQRMYAAQLSAMLLPPQDIEDSVTLLGLANIYFALIKDGSQDHEHLAAVEASIESACGFLNDKFGARLGPDRLGQNVFSSITDCSAQLFSRRGGVPAAPHSDTQLLADWARCREKGAFVYSFDGQENLSKQDEYRLAEAQGVSEELRERVWRSEAQTLEGIVAKMEALLTFHTEAERGADTILDRDGFDELFARQHEFKDIDGHAKLYMGVIANLRAIMGQPLGGTSACAAAIAEADEAWRACEASEGEAAIDAAADAHLDALKRLAGTRATTGPELAEKMRALAVSGGLFASGVDDAELTAALIADARSIGGAA